MIKSDLWIIDQSKKNELISPFEQSLCRKENGSPVVSFGPSSYGYDARIAPEFKIFTNSNQNNRAGIVDPKSFDEGNFSYHVGDSVIVPPNSFVLARTIERFKMPRDVIGLVLNKSTYARCGLDCLTTVIEPEWEGELVLEFANSTPLPVILYAYEGACQIVFMQGDEECQTSYKDRKGKYQNQKGVQTPKI